MTAELFRWATFWVIVVVVAIGQLTLIAAALRFKERPDGELPANLRVNPRVELGWTLVTAVVTAGVLVAAYVELIAA